MYKIFYVAFFMCLIALASPVQARDLELADYMNWETVADPQISPDGSVILYTRRLVDNVEDRWLSEIWMMDRDGDRNRFLTKGSNVRWSPSGDRIAYIGSDDKGSQIFVRWMDAEGAISQLTHHNYKISSLSWSPDGSQIAFQAGVPIKPSWKIKMPARPKGAKWTGEPRITDRLFYRRDRRGFLDSFSHIFIVPDDGGTPRQISSGPWNAGSGFGGGPQWTPDGSAILFTGEVVEEGDPDGMTSNIYSVDIKTSEVTRLNGPDGSWGSPRISPDGTRIAYMGNTSTTPEGPLYPPVQFHLMDRDGSNDRIIIEDVGNRINDLRWKDDGSGLYASYGWQGLTNVHFIALDGRISDVTTGAHRLVLSSISRSGIGVGTYSTPEITGDVASVNLADGSIARLSDVNGDILYDVELGAVEEIWYSSYDGTPIQGWIMTPPDFDPEQKYPLLLSIHGGPNAMYGVNFNFSFQEFAARGYVVLYTNPRGSTGYGAAFANAIDDQYPGPVDYGDLMAGVDAVMARGYIDESRQYVQGCSGGGILTSWIVTQTDRFAAAVTRCPIVNWISAAGTSDSIIGANNLFSTRFWIDPESWIDHSAIFHVENVTTPTLIMVGERDLRTPVPQSEEFFVALRLVGVPTKLIRMQKEWHGTSSVPSNMLRTQLYMQSWFDKYSHGADSADME